MPGGDKCYGEKPNRLNTRDVKRNAIANSIAGTVTVMR